MQSSTSSREPVPGPALSSAVWVGGAVAVTVGALCLLAPAHALAAESAPAGFLEVALRMVDDLGPLAPLAYILAVAVCECIPLFPTQPLSLGAGLLFGAPKGAVLVLAGTSLAAVAAFSISRGIGRQLAERLVKHEGLSSLSSDDGDGGSTAGGTAGAIQRQLARVEAAIESGGFKQQALAIFLLRLTPAPFSASNYLLGLSPLPLAPYMLGTVTCMTLWSAFYASLGGASRVLLRRGADLDTLLADLMERASSASGALAVVGVVAVLGAGAYLGRDKLRSLVGLGSGIPPTGVEK